MTALSGMQKGRNRQVVLSGHQPCYLPSLQLFAKMAKSDAFMHCGHLQFQRRSWHHRNYIMLGGKRKGLSIPIHVRFGQPISDAWFDDPHWKKKHLETIAQAYKDAPFFDLYYYRLVEIFYSIPHSLAMLNMALTEYLAGCLGIQTRFVDSAEWHLEGDAVDMIIQMCKAVQADWYLSNEGALGYISPADEVRMLKAGVMHQWLEFDDPDKEPLSAIHHLFTLGPDAAELVW